MADPVSGDVPSPIEPDTKSWTWVLERRCPECGFDASTVDRDEIPQRTRAVAAELADLLRSDPPLARRRPDPSTWSAAEYGCHVRDVFVLFDERLQQMLAEDGPHFANWDQDATAIEQRYDLADPVAVAGELVPAADVIADRFAGVAGDEWSRTGVRSDGAEFTIDSFARYFLHDPVHHVHDVRTGYKALRDPGVGPPGA